MNRSRILQELPTAHPDYYIEVEVYYEPGGRNFITGAYLERAYMVAANAVEGKIGGNGKAYHAFSGTAQVLQKTRKFSEKTFLALDPDEDTVQYLIGRTLAKNLLELA
jgi:hypothetical protein